MEALEKDKIWNSSLHIEKKTQRGNPKAATNKTKNFYIMEMLTE